MKITKDYTELGIIDFEKAKRHLEEGHVYMAWYGYTKDGEIVEYKDDDFYYPAPSVYPSLKD